MLYACHLVEDLGGDTDLDRIITMTERVALAAFGQPAGDLTDGKDGTR